MTQISKFILKVILGNSDNSIEFEKLCGLLDSIGFKCRIKGSHHIFYKEGIEEIINIQPNGKLAKSYQVKQIRHLLLKYKLVNYE